MPPNRKLTEFFSKSISPREKLYTQGRVSRSGSLASGSRSTPPHAPSEFSASTRSHDPIIDIITDGDTSSTDESVVLISASQPKSFQSQISSPGTVGVSCRRPLKHPPPREIVDLSSPGSSLSSPREGACVWAHIVISDSDIPSSNSSIVYLGSTNSLDKRKGSEGGVADNSVEEAMQLTTVAPTSSSASEPENESMDWESSPSHVISTPPLKPLSQTSSRSSLPTPTHTSPDTSIADAPMRDPRLIKPPDTLRLPTPSTPVSSPPSSPLSTPPDRGSSSGSSPKFNTVASARMRHHSSEDEGLTLSIDKLDDDMSDGDDSVDIDNVLGLDRGIGDPSSPSPQFVTTLRRSARTVQKPKNIFLKGGSSHKMRKKTTEFEKLIQDEERREKKGFAAASATAEKLAKKKDADDSDNESPVTKSRKRFSSRAPRTPVRFNRKVSEPADSGSDDEESRQREIELRQRVVNKYIPNADSGTLSAILTSDVMMGLKGSDNLIGSRRFWRKQKHDGTVPTQHLARPQFQPTYHLATAMHSAVFGNDSLLLSSLCARWRLVCARMEQAKAQEVARVLMDAVFFCDNSVVADCALNTLGVTFQAMSSEPSHLGSLFRDTVVRPCFLFGASPDAMALLSCLDNSLGHGFDIKDCSETVKDLDPRVLPRLISLLTSLALNHSTSHNEISDAILIMLMIACDPASSAELRMQISNSIHMIISRPLLEGAFGFHMSQKLARATQHWSAAEKAFLLSFIPSWCSSSARILSWTAFGMLIPSEIDNMTLDRFQGPPPLVRILEELYGLEGEEHYHLLGLFSASEGGDKIPNYLSLAQRVQILDAMVCDWPAFVLHEHRAQNTGNPRPASEGSPLNSSKKGNAPMQFTELLINGLEILHDGISDTRVSHVDRTMAKDLMHRLRMRLTYQRASVMESLEPGRSGRGRIDSHFALRSEGTPSKTRPGETE